MDERTLRDIRGMVFDIQHYSIHDGPGIRTNVFFKGCPLCCLWCSNPESQNKASQLMFRADRCTGCGACISVCPVGAISFHGKIVQNKRTGQDGPAVPDGPMILDGPTVPDKRTVPDVCTGCGACVAVCPQDAREIVGEIKSAGEVFDEVAQDVLFYAEDGGVTLTGGEVLSQPAFASAILQLCRMAGIRTAVETCGFADGDVLEDVLQYADLVLYDLKEMDPERHQAYTGVRNEKILENLKRINDNLPCEIWVRIPLIPGYNDDKENLTATADFVIESVPRCTQIHLLPFHRLGEGKYEQLEKEPNGFSSTVPDDSDMESLREYVRSLGIDCR